MCLEGKRVGTHAVGDTWGTLRNLSVGSAKVETPSRPSRVRVREGHRRLIICFSAIKTYTQR